MEEIEIIRCNNKKITDKIKYILMIMIPIAVISLIAVYLVESKGWDYKKYVYTNFSIYKVIPFSLLISGAISIALMIFYIVVRDMELVVTEKRVYGKTIFGRRIDLPLDSISSIGMCLFNGIFIATSSGKIKFLLMKNKKEIHKAISDLLIKRQEKNKKESTQIDADNRYTSIDDLRKYKELLNEGIITKEEFDVKKKQLLNL